LTFSRNSDVAIATKEVYHTPVANDSIVVACITAKPLSLYAGKEIVKRKRDIIVTAASALFESAELRVKLLPSTQEF
jgi:hypothetical protein